jgi:hypothetical protein
MQVYNSLAELAGLVPPPAPESEKPIPAPRVYDCTGCRFVDSHGLVCDVCLRRILDGKKTQPKASLLAACFDGHGMTLLRGKRTALV